MQNKKTYCFDIDGTICSNTYGNYEKATPYFERINFINNLYNEGHLIKLLTARGSSTGINWRKFTEKQLRSWKLNYHSLDFGKIDADIFIDDKGYNSENFFKSKHDYINEHIEALLKTNNKEVNDQINLIGNYIYESYLNGNKIIFAGNGGSFSDCLHMSAELTGRFEKNRNPLPSIVLGSNGSSMSAISNDFNFDNCFSRELKALGKKGDTFIALSTSGESRNILNCFNETKNIGLKSIFLTSERYTNKIPYIDIVLEVKSNRTSIIQEVHILMLHLICIEIENKLASLK